MLLNYLRDHWQDFFSVSCPPEVSVATITSCRLEHGNDLVLVFINRDRAPRYIIKVGRSPRFAFKLEREFEALRWFSKRPHSAVPAPRPYHLGVVDERTFLVQEAIAGVSLARLLTERGLTPRNRRLLTEATDLLVEIHRLPRESDREVATAIDPRLDVSDRDRSKLTQREQQVSDPARRLYVHGDYWPLNLLVREGRLAGVVDWEFSEGGASAPFDMPWFLINTAYLLGRNLNSQVSIEQSFVEVFFRDHPHTVLMRSLYDRYSRSMGLAASLFLPLLEITLARMAQRELVAYGSPGKMDQVCSKLLRYVLDHEEELRI